MPERCILEALLRRVLYCGHSIQYSHLVWRCLWLFCLCMKYIRNRWTDLRLFCDKFTRKMCLVPRSDEFEGQGQRSKVKVTRDKKTVLSVLSAACVRFMSGKTSLASSFLFILYYSVFRLTGRCLCCVRFNCFSIYRSDWLGRTSPKLPILVSSGR